MSHCQITTLPKSHVTKMYITLWYIAKKNILRKVRYSQQNVWSVDGGKPKIEPIVWEDEASTSSTSGASPRPTAPPQQRQAPAQQPTAPAPIVGQAITAIGSTQYQQQTAQQQQHQQQHPPRRGSPAGRMPGRAAGRGRQTALRSRRGGPGGHSPGALQQQQQHGPGHRGMRGGRGAKRGPYRQQQPF